MENDKRLETIEKPSGAIVRENLVKKFGERYSTEPMIEVDGYFFYMDALVRGDDLFKEYFLDEGNEAKRKEYLEHSTEDFKTMARILHRYRVNQEDFKGVGQWGSVRCFSFCHGAEEDKFGNKKYLDAKVLLHKNYSKDGNTQYSFEGIKDIESFGFKVIEGMTTRILDVREESNIEDVNLHEIFIDNIPKRFEWWQGQFELKHKDVWLKKSDRLGLWLKDNLSNTSVDIEEWIKLAVSEMGFAKMNERILPEARQESWKKDELIDTFRRSVSDAMDYCLVREHFKYDDESMTIALEGKTRQLWKQLEDVMVGGQELKILYPDGLSALPAIYLMVQWLAYYFSGEESLAKKDIKEYWSRVKIVKKEDLLSENVKNKVLLVTGTSYDWDYDSDEVDRPEIAEIRAKLGDRLIVADLASGKLR